MSCYFIYTEGYGDILHIERLLCFEMCSNSFKNCIYFVYKTTEDYHQQDPVDKIKFKIVKHNSPSEHKKYSAFFTNDGVKWIPYGLTREGYAAFEEASSINLLGPVEKIRG